MLMNDNFTIHRATAADTQEVAVMVGELLTEIMDAIAVTGMATNRTMAARCGHRENRFAFISILLFCLS